MDKVLIDTDVILDVFLDRKPFVDNSKEILELCFRKRINGFITAVIVANTYYITQSREGHDIAIDSIKVLMKIVKILPIDERIIVKALHSKFKDFEDALQNFAAIENGKITTIITRNVKDYKYSSIVVLTPEEYLKVF